MSTPEPDDRPRGRGGELRRLDFGGDDADLVRALVAGHPGAPAALFDRHAPHVRQVLARIMGLDPELPDLLHEVFARALRNIGSIQDGARLRAWLTAIAVNTARGCIRGRRQRRWLLFPGTDQVPEPATPAASAEMRQAMRCTYEVLGRMTPDLRIAFALRYIQGMELTDVAEACDVSLATIKRRLRRAEKRFVVHARTMPELRRWLEEGGRWSA